MSESTVENETSNNNNPNNLETQLDQAGKEIWEEQQKELSNIMEVNQVSDKLTKYLAKKNAYKIAFDDGKEETFTRKPLSAKKNRTIF